MMTIEARGLMFRYTASPSRLAAAAGPASTRTRQGGGRMIGGRPSKLTQTSGTGSAGLQPIDLDAGRGEVIGLLGPNGAGKSTLLRVLATCLTPTGGMLRLFGADAVPPGPTLRRRIGYAADQPVHFDALSGFENARFFARAAGLARQPADRAVQRLFERLGLAPDAERPVGEYSHGMRRKLLLAQALAPAPALIVLDEPTLGLDPPTRRVLRELLVEHAAAGATVVLATHDVVEAQRACARVLFLHEGRIVLQGEPADLLRRADAGSQIEVELSAVAPPAIRLDGATVVHATPDRLELRAAAHGAVLPALCAELLEHGAVIRSIHVREPDLGDLFEQVTGARLDAISAAPSSGTGSASGESVDERARVRAATPLPVQGERDRGGR